MSKIRLEPTVHKNKTKPTEGNKPHDSVVPKTPVICEILNSYSHSFFFFFPYTHTFILKYVQYVNYWIKTLKQLFHFRDNHYI